MRSAFNRRRFLSALALASAYAASPSAMSRERLRQGLTPHLFNADLEDTCKMAVSLGIQALDFVSNPKDWPLLKKYGLVMSVLRVDYGGGISTLTRAPAGPPGWNAIGTPDRDGLFEAAFRDRIEAAAANGIPNILVTCGARGEVSYEAGKRNAISFLERIRAQAEQRGVIIVMENINSGHAGGPPEPPGSMFDHLPWGLDVVTQVNSPRVKLLVDLYHAQLMDGNITNFLRKHMHLIGHFHAGGVPGRNEIDDTQELNYRHLARTISDLGYRGFVSHEWTPSAGQDKMALLRKCIDIIDGR